MLLDEDSEILQKDRNLNAEKASVVYPDGHPEPEESICPGLLSEVPVVLSHSMPYYDEVSHEMLEFE